MRALPLLLLILSILSCQGGTTDQSDTYERKHLPDMIMHQSTMRLNQRGETPIEFSAASISYYPDDELAVMESVHFIQRDEEGNVRLEGSADRGELNTNGNILSLSGNVTLDEKSEKLSINTGEGLVYNSSTEEVTADGSVVVESEDGIFRGEGFYANLKLAEYSFRKLDEGTFTI